MSWPIDDRAAARMRSATAASPTISSIAGRCSSESADLTWMAMTRRQYCTLSVTIFMSSGKCHPYHSLTRMAKVLRPLSIWSRSAIDWMIMLSTRFTLNLIFDREYACPRPSCALSMSPARSSGMYLSKWLRTPRRSSRTVTLYTHLMPVAS
eukprot:Amastigsp_a174404_1229.p3 type:complete len:152 gc:universal Amastigsp_a174404_1229:932-1387(+)